VALFKVFLVESYDDDAGITLSKYATHDACMIFQRQRDVGRMHALNSDVLKFNVNHVVPVRSTRMERGRGETWKELSGFVADLDLSTRQPYAPQKASCLTIILIREQLTIQVVSSKY
jgi:hypothetical protein